MRARQKGITLIGFILVVVFVGSIAYGGLKVLPFFLEQMKVISILEDVKREMDGTGATIASIRTAIGKRLDIEMVNGITTQEFIVKKSKNGYMVRANYENRAQYIGSLYLVVVTDRQVEITR